MTVGTLQRQQELMVALWDGITMQAQVAADIAELLNELASILLEQVKEEL